MDFRKERKEAIKLEGKTTVLYWQLKRMLMNKEPQRSVFQDRRNHRLFMETLDEMKRVADLAYKLNTGEKTFNSKEE